MTVLSHEDASTIAQVWAARDSEAPARNSERLENWLRRCFRDAVRAPEPKEPSQWPAKRVSIEAPTNVTKLPNKGRLRP